MNLQRLRYFRAVADELHFGRAARRLHMAQPPLSQQIRLLEAELGVQLFERTTRSVSLTAAGEVLLAEADRVIVAVENAERAMAEFSSGEGGRLRMGFVDSAAYEVMPRYLRAHRERWPKVEHDLQVMSSSAQDDALVAASIDVGISRTAATGPGMSSQEIGREPLFLAAGPDGPLRRRKNVSLVDIAEPVIGFDRRLAPALHEQLRALFTAAGQRYEPAMEASEYTTILGLVASGEGVAVVPDGVRTFRPDGVNYARVTDDDAVMAMFANHRTDDRRRLVAQSIELLQAIF